MAEHGRVLPLPADPNAKFCFIRPIVAPGAPKLPDVFCHWVTHYPDDKRPPQKDDEVEYEFAPSTEPGKGPKVTRIISVTKAAPTAAPPTTPAPQPASVQPSPAAPQPVPPASHQFIIDLSFGNEHHTDDAYELEIKVKVTQGNKPMGGAQTALQIFTRPELNGLWSLIPGDAFNTQSNGEAIYLFVIYRDNPGDPPVTDPGRLTIAAAADCKGQVVKASATRLPPTPPAPAIPPAPPTPSTAAAPPTPQCISAQLLGLREGAICFRVFTSTAKPADAPGVPAMVRVISAMKLEVKYSQKLGGIYQEAIDGLMPTENDGVVFVKILVDPSTRNGLVQFYVDGTDIQTEPIYVKTSLAQAARPTATT